MGKKVPRSICIFGANFMLEQAIRLENEINGALDARDIEHIHRMRVASRRLRNAFEHFNDCFPKKTFKKWQDDIRLVTKSLGTARDLDIQIERLSGLYDESMDPGIKPGYQRLLLRLKQRRAKAQEKVNKTLNKMQDEKTLEKIRLGVKKLSVDTDNVYLFTPALYQRAFNAINTTLYDFLSHEDFIHAPENVEELHAMRIAGKKLRYSIELFAPIYKQAMIPYIQIMKDLQDQLGNIHDDDVWISWLPKFIGKEKTRIEDFYGSSSPLDKLLPGILNLIEDRKNARAMEYQAFLTTWKTLQDENTWSFLYDIINMPMRLESILQDLSTEEDFDPEVEPTVEDEVEQPEEQPVEVVEEQEEDVDETPVSPPAENEDFSDEDNNVEDEEEQPKEQPIEVAEEQEEEVDETPVSPPTENEDFPDEDNNVWIHLDEPPQTP